MTITQETAEKLRDMADRIESLDLDGIRLSLFDLSAYNDGLQKISNDLSVDFENVHKADGLYIGHYGKTVKAIIELNAYLSIPVFVARDIHICTLDHVWTRIACAAKDLPMPLRKKLFAVMRKWREKDLDEKRAKVDVLECELAELQALL